MKKRGSIRSVKLSGGKTVSAINFGFEESYKKRWNSAIALHDLHQTTSRRYTQSPVLRRKNKHKLSFDSKQAMMNAPSSVDQSNMNCPQGGRNDSLEVEEKAPFLKLSPSKDDYSFENSSDQKIVLQTKTNPGLNTFGTPVTLSPKKKLSKSEDSLPPPPSPKTLQRALSSG